MIFTFFSALFFYELLDCYSLAWESWCNAFFYAKEILCEPGYIFEENEFYCIVISYAPDNQVLS